MRHHTSARHTRCSDTDGKLHSRHLLSFLYDKTEEQTVEPLRQKGRKEFDFQMSKENVKMKGKKKEVFAPILRLYSFLFSNSSIFIYILSFRFFSLLNLTFLSPFLSFILFWGEVLNFIPQIERSCGITRRNSVLFYRYSCAGFVSPKISQTKATRRPCFLCSTLLTLNHKSLSFMLATLTVSCLRN